MAVMDQKIKYVIKPNSWRKYQCAMDPIMTEIFFAKAKQNE